MSRGLWFVAGAGAGVYAAVRGRRVAEAFTPDGLRDRVGAAVVGARLFRDEVAQGRADTEPQVRRHLGLVSDGAPELRGSNGGASVRQIDGHLANEHRDNERRESEHQEVEHREEDHT